MTRLLKIAEDTAALSSLLRGQAEFISRSGFEIHMASGGGEKLEEIVRQENVPHHTIPITTKFSPLGNLWSIWKTIRLIRKLQPVVVHTYGANAGKCGMIAARVCGVQHRLHTVTRLPLTKKMGVIRWLREKMTLTHATQVYPDSELISDYLRKHFKGDADKLKMIAKGSSNGVDLDHYHPHEDVEKKAGTLTNLWRLQQRVVFIFTGAFEAGSGIEELVDAFIALKRKFPPIKLLLMDPESERKPHFSAELQKKIEKEPDIVDLGYQKDIRPYLLMSDVHVCPSRSYEKFPVEILRAAAMGLPSIATGIDGCHDLIDHRINGLLVPPKKVEALMAAMLALASTEDWRNTYGQKIKERIVRKYNQKDVWYETLREYQEVVGAFETVGHTTSPQMSSVGL